MHVGVYQITTATGGIQSAIALASQKTGIDFNYLLGQAQLESGMNANAHAGTSSASGLYQFIDQSWLRVMKAHGAEHGMSWAADSIQQTASGRMVVNDPATRRAILAMRNDPNTASIMAAEHASDNKAALESSLGRPASGTDLYMAHFLGLGGARHFLKTMTTSPDRTGAAMFPAAARANRSVFYTANGQPRTLADIYGRFTDKLGQGAVAAGGSAPTTPNTPNSPAQLLAQTLQMGDATVIPGANETSDSAAAWAKSALDRINGTQTTLASVLKPGPDSARLAYMMLANMGG
jgi:hypothetical protein